VIEAPDDVLGISFGDGLALSQSGIDVAHPGTSIREMDEVPNL